ISSTRKINLTATITTSAALEKRIHPPVTERKIHREDYSTIIRARVVSTVLTNTTRRILPTSASLELFTCPSCSNLIASVIRQTTRQAQPNSNHVASTYSYR